MSMKYKVGQRVVITDYAEAKREDGSIMFYTEASHLDNVSVYVIEKTRINGSKVVDGKWFNHKYLRPYSKVYLNKE